MKSKFLPFLLLLAVLPVLIFRDYTPSNELRYLSIVDEALRNGDIFTFTNHGIQYADKPPLYLWIPHCRVLRLLHSSVTSGGGDKSTK